MKKFLSVVGALSLVIALVVIGFVGYSVYQGRGLDASSKAYVEVNVPPIISTWSKDELLKRSSPQLLKIINEEPEQVEKLFKKLSQLGSLTHFGDVKGEANIWFTTQNGKVITAAYVGTGMFEKGKAQISVKLIQSPSGEWQFLLFLVTSPLLI